MSDQIDFNDLQALLRFAHGHLHDARFLLLRINDVQAARNWLQTAPVTTAQTKEKLPDEALQIAFTSTGLQVMEIDESIINEFSEDFISGMVGDDNRSRRLGDFGNNHPDNWLWGNNDEVMPHVLVMLYSQAGELDSWQQKIQVNGFDKAFTQLNALETSRNGELEPFGFTDGISQPKIDWQRRISTDLHERDRFANLLALGEVVLGYPNEYGLYTERPLLDPHLHPQALILPVAEESIEMRDLGCNGSYLVLRQLSQDVPAFWKYIDTEVTSNPEQREQLAAAMVGRQRDGTPLAETSSESIQGIDADDRHSSLNLFTFDKDARGTRCPIGAHIRRVNPRTGDFPVGVSGMISRLIRTLGFARRHPQEDLVSSTRFHRILRRGRAYGSSLTPEQAIKPNAAQDERGLQFVCLGANISRQFNFVQSAWSMSAKFSGLPTESDPLLGNREPLLNGESTNRFTMPQQAGQARCVADLPQFVAVRGGAYFFMPGIKSLRFIARSA